MSIMSDELKVAIEAARAGAEVALKYYNTTLEVDYKTDRSPVTIADKETEETIKRTILNAFPDAKFVGEETGGRPTGETFWIIDPIDGTKMFIRGLPYWSVLIALCKNKEITLGVSYMPDFDELIHAEKGAGAYLNDKKIIVSKVDDITKAYFSYSEITWYKDKGLLINSLDNFACVRSIGDAHSYHLVAKGKFDIFTEPSPSLWDIAPFKVIVEEAGGKVTDLKGNPWNVDNKGGIIASNGLLHDQVIRILNP